MILVLLARQGQRVVRLKAATVRLRPGLPSRPEAAGGGGDRLQIVCAHVRDQRPSPMTHPRNRQRRGVVGRPRTGQSSKGEGRQRPE